MITDLRIRAGAWILTGLSLAVAGTTAGAHTTIESTEPAQSAVLARSPPDIAIRFEHQAQLTSVVVHAAGLSARKLEFEPHGSAREFKLLRPALTPGRNELAWKGLSTDGHVIEGKLVFVIEPTPPQRD